MQHLISNNREEDVVNKAATEDLLYGSRQATDVGSLAERRVAELDSQAI
jgi:hypothetical protein